jgi:hypothetical protein
MVLPQAPGIPRNRHPVFNAMTRTVALLTGWILMILGVGLGVTIVMLPAGVVIAVLGILLVVWAWAAPGFREN